VRKVPWPTAFRLVEKLATPPAPRSRCFAYVRQLPLPESLAASSSATSCGPSWLCVARHALRVLPSEADWSVAR